MHRLSGPRRPPPLDRSLAIASIGIGLGSGLALYLGGLQSQIGLSIAVLLAGVVYLATSPTDWVQSRDSDGGPSDPLRPEAPAILAPFVLLAAAAAGLVMVAGAANSQSRPAWTLMLPVVLATIVWLQIVVFRHDSLHIVQTLVVGMATVLATIVVFPYDGGDTWTHLYNATLVLADGRIGAVQFPYSEYPLYPSVLAVLSSVTGMDPGIAARLLNTAVAGLSILLIYVWAKSGMTAQRAAIAAFLLMGGKWFLYWTSSVVAMSVASVFFTFVIVILMRRLVRALTVWESTLLVGAVVVLPFFHPVVAAATAAVFAVVWLTEVILGRVGLATGRSQALLVLAVLGPVVVVAHWAYAGEVVFERLVVGLAQVIGTGDQLGAQAGGVRSDVLTVLFDDSNFYFLICAALIGLFLLVKARQSPAVLITAIVGLGFVGLGYFLQLINFKAGVPDRWFLFGSILLVIPAAFALSALVDRSRTTSLVLVCLGAAYFFSGMLNSQVNKDSPLVEETLVYRSDITASEYSGLQQLERVMAARDVAVRTDSWLWSSLQYSHGQGEDVWYWDPVRIGDFEGIFAGRPGYLSHEFFGYSQMGDFARQVEAEARTLSQFFDAGDIQLLERVAPAPPSP